MPEGGWGERIEGVLLLMGEDEKKVEGRHVERRGGGRVGKWKRGWWKRMGGNMV